MARRVGIVSIGIMGTAMMCNLVKDGFAQGAMARSAEAGGVAATSPRDVAEKAEILITSLPMSVPSNRRWRSRPASVPRPDRGLGSGGPALD